MTDSKHDPQSKTHEAKTHDTQEDTSQIATPVKGDAVSVATTPEVGAYAGKMTNLKGDKDLSSASWQKTKNTAWNATPHGRLAIRAFSRGILGASFFALGGLLTSRWLHGDMREIGGAERYDPSKAFAEQSNPLQMVAKAIDSTLGNAIESTVGAVAGEEAGHNAVRFGVFSGGQGRSLGHEALAVTFDFFCASIGDAMGRDLVDQLDPHRKRDWVDDKGHVDIEKAITGIGKAAVRYVTYNGGEDLAVALPYVYFMKGQRALINKASPGFYIDNLHGNHGANFKLDDNNKIIGSYGTEGMIDLQGRFTAYNIGTLMYREAYNHIAALHKGEQSALYGAADDPALAKRNVLQKAGDIGKWMLRSVVKATIYMTPAVPFFSVFRSSQNKGTAAFIHPEKGELSIETPDGRHPYTHVQPSDLMDINGVPGQYGHFEGDMTYRNIGNNGWYTTESGINHVSANGTAVDFRRHTYEQNGNLIDHGLNITGKVQNRARRRASLYADRHIDPKLSNNTIYDGTKQYFGITAGQFANRFMNASMSYTPYMYAKTETANLWDDGKMDLATERMIDGATSFKFGEFKAGAGEVWRAILHRPFVDPKREAEAERRIELDHSASVGFTDEQYKQSRQKRAQTYKQSAYYQQAGDEKLAAEQLAVEQSAAAVDKASAGKTVAKEEPSTAGSWRDHLYAGRKDVAAKDSVSADEKPRSHAEREEMKKALEELSPPTNAVH